MKDVAKEGSKHLKFIPCFWKVGEQGSDLVRIKTKVLGKLTTHVPHVKRADQECMSHSFRPDLSRPYKNKLP